MVIRSYKVSIFVMIEFQSNTCEIVIPRYTAFVSIFVMIEFQSNCFLWFNCVKCCSFNLCYDRILVKLVNARRKCSKLEGFNLCYDRILVKLFAHDVELPLSNSFNLCYDRILVKQGQRTGILDQGIVSIFVMIEFQSNIRSSPISTTIFPVSIFVMIEFQSNSESWSKPPKAILFQSLL